MDAGRRPGQGRSPCQPHQPGISRQGRGARARPVRRPDGQVELHGVLPPAAHRPRADRGAALLPRRAARRDRGARDDAHQRRRADDARRRPGIPPGGRRRRDPRLRPGHPRHVRVVRAAARDRTGAGGVRQRSGGGRRGRRACDPRCRRQVARLRPSRPPAARPARRADPRARGRPRGERAARPAGALHARQRRHGMGQAADDERLHADRGGDARPRLPVRRGEGRPDPRPHGRPPRPSGRGAPGAARLPHGGESGGGDRVRAPPEDAPG